MEMVQFILAFFTALTISGKSKNILVQFNFLKKTKQN